MQQIMRMKTDNEFQQVKMKDLNGKYNVAMSMTNMCGEKPLLLNKRTQKKNIETKNNIWPKQGKNITGNNN